MRKELITPGAEPPRAPDREWLDLEAHARVRLTSEDPDFPIEGALRDATGRGWRAALAGPQKIEVSFDAPRPVREVYLRFDNAEPRTHEFVLRASSDGGRSYREIVRQQFNFSAATTTEEEHYFPDLAAVTDLTLAIVPDVSGGDARASLSALRIR